ncbi:MAG: LysR family transcriptional regulator [Gammaproteobacteria bacterium]
MDLRQLRYFLAVASTGSFTKAAELIPLAQSALSRHMRLLEEELDVILLIRTGRGVELTEQGKFLVDRARLILDYSEDTKRSLQSWNDNPSGLVRLGMTPTCTLTLAPTLLHRLREKHDKIGLQVSEGLSSSLGEWLGDGRLDMAIVFTEPKNVVGGCERLAREELVLVVPAGSECPNPATIEDMAAMPLIAPFRRKGIRIRMTNAFKDKGFEFQPAFEIDALSAMKDLVSSGAGSAILAKSSVKRELESSEVEIRRIDAKNMYFHVYLLMSKLALHSRAAESVAEMVRQTAKEIYICD